MCPDSNCFYGSQSGRWMRAGHGSRDRCYCWISGVAKMLHLKPVSTLWVVFMGARTAPTCFSFWLAARKAFFLGFILFLPLSPNKEEPLAAAEWMDSPNKFRHSEQLSQRVRSPIQHTNSDRKGTSCWYQWKTRGGGRGREKPPLPIPGKFLSPGADVLEPLCIKRGREIAMNQTLNLYCIYSQSLNKRDAANEYLVILFY